jgi:PA-IL-like protein
MSTTDLFRRFLATAAILSIVSLSVMADTIRLKDGSIIKGKIVRFSGGNFSVEIGEGSRRREMTFSAGEIESIQFDGPDFRSAASSGEKKADVIKVSSNTPAADTTAAAPKVVIKDDLPDEDQPIRTPPVTVPKTTAQSSPAKVQPIQLDLKVLADNTSNGWTNSGWVVRKGQRIRITGEGSISLGKGKKATPSGDPDLPDDEKLLKSVATGALIAVIGDDNNDFIYVGAQREFTASRDGTLFLGVNEGVLDDNSGSFSVKIEIIPTGSD